MLTGSTSQNMCCFASECMRYRCTTCLPFATGAVGSGLPSGHRRPHELTTQVHKAGRGGNFVSSWRCSMVLSEQGESHLFIPGTVPRTLRGPAVKKAMQALYLQSCSEPRCSPRCTWQGIARACMVAQHSAEFWPCGWTMVSW